MLDMLWALSHERRLSKLEDTGGLSRDGARTLAQLERDNAELERRVDAMALTVSAMFELLQAGGALSHEKLVAKVNEIDARDGVVDGRSAQVGPRPCASCGRPVGPKHARCIYCGGAKRPL